MAWPPPTRYAHSTFAVMRCRSVLTDTPDEFGGNDKLDECLSGGDLLMVGPDCRRPFS